MGLSGDNLGSRGRLAAGFASELRKIMQKNWQSATQHYHHLRVVIQMHKFG